MISVALIGADGAGKTTIAEMLRSSFPMPLKYLYMGINIESSNIALPTSRLIEFAKSRNASAGQNGSAGTSLHVRKPSGRKGLLKHVWLFIRLVNRLAEEWYRQLVSWIYRKRGFIVLYDRHFLFDFEKDGPSGLPLAEKIHRWCLHRFYPEPDIVLFLDAPPEVLFARKGEATIEFLRARRQAYLRQGKYAHRFEQIDATQPLDTVFSNVCSRILACYEARRN